MTDDDHVAVAGDDADGILDLLTVDCGGEDAGLFGGEDAPAEAKHGGFKRETGAGGGLVEEAGEDAALVIESAAAGHDAFHFADAAEEFHQQREGELLRLDHVMEVESGDHGVAESFFPGFNQLHTIIPSCARCSLRFNECSASQLPC